MVKRHPIKLGLLTIVVVAGAWLVNAATGYPPVLKPKDGPAAYFIDDVRLISMVPGAPEAEEGRSVLIEDGVITAIYAPGEEPVGLPEDLVTIDGAGRTLLPGLIDAHVHVWDEAELAGYLGHGVTGIRNMSGMPFHLPLIERIETGKILGPDFVTTGPILNSPGPNQQDNHKLVVTADEARAAVREQYEAGYRHVKVYSNLLPEPYAAILEEAEALGMSVSGHTPEGHRGEGVPKDAPFEIDFHEVLDDGFLTVEHTESIFWHGLRDKIDEDAMAVLAQEIAAAGVTVTPTLVAHANLVRVAESKGAYVTRPGTETINPLLKKFETGGYEFWSQMDPAPHERPRADFYLVATKMMADAGVPLIAGSDAGIFVNIPGESVVDELELLVEAGLTPHDALKAATVTAADTLSFVDRGQVRVGYGANLILVDGDPLADISALRDLNGVMIGGQWFDEDGVARLKEGAGQTSLIRSGRHVIALLMAL